MQVCNTYLWHYSGYGGVTSTGTTGTLITNQSGLLSVAGYNACGEGPPSTMNITLATTLTQPQTITGNIHPYPGYEVTYSVEYFPGITNRLWTVPSSWIITSGQGTNSITVVPAATAGNITVTPTSCYANTGPTSTLAVTYTPDPYLPRANYGQKYEPTSGILHGAGQTYSSNQTLDAAFDNYSDMMPDNNMPIIFMAYNSPGTGQSFYDNLKARLDAYEAEGQYVMPQFGFYLPSGTSTMTEAQLAQLSAGLQSLGRPVFIRIGYEINGTWYNPMYQPANFVSEFRRVVDRLRADGVEFASLWNTYPAISSWSYLDDFYPGDAYVDWWSIDVFSTWELTAPNTITFLNQAAAHGKPVMVGEATPRYVGADNAGDWNTWFVPFFNLFKNYPGLKGHTYIDWNWGLSRWPDWGNATLETGNSTVRTNYMNEMSHPIYKHAEATRPDYTIP